MSFYSQCGINEPKVEAKLRLRNVFQDIYEKYGHDFEDDADEIDLNTMTVVVDRGDIEGMGDTPFGKFMNFVTDDEESEEEESNIERKIKVSSVEGNIDVAQSPQYHDNLPPIEGMRKRGRPRKVPEGFITQQADFPGDTPVKRGRGRPRKQPLTEAEMEVRNTEKKESNFEPTMSELIKQLKNGVSASDLIKQANSRVLDGSKTLPLTESSKAERTPSKKCVPTRSYKKMASGMTSGGEENDLDETPYPIHNPMVTSGGEEEENYSQTGNVMVVSGGEDEQTFIPKANTISGYLSGGDY